MLALKISPIWILMLLNLIYLRPQRKTQKQQNISIYNILYAYKPRIGHQHVEPSARSQFFLCDRSTEMRMKLHFWQPSHLIQPDAQRS